MSRAELSQLSVKHDALMDKITHVQDVQCAWLLLLCCCSAARANHYLRVVHPDLCSTFAAHHDASLRRVLCSLLGVDPSFLFWNVASLPLSLGGLALRSASLLSRAACWADSLQIVLSHQILRSLHDLNPQRGFVPPTWEDLAAGLRPAPDQWEIMEPGQPRHWQKVATEPVHGHHITSAVWLWLSVSGKAPIAGRCVVSGNTFLPLLASVGAASSWTLLATTGQLAEEQECWVAVPSHWKALQHVFAVRQVPVSPQTSWCGTLTWCLKSVCTVVVWKSSPTGFLYSMEPNLPFTRQWSRH